MSVVKRILSGSLASWFRIIINLAAQLTLVPLYLTYWSVSTFGAWIVLQALIGMITLLNIGQQDFLAYEFLRIGRDNKVELNRYFWSGLFVGVFLNVIQLCIIYIICYTGVILYMISNKVVVDIKLIDDARIVLFILGINFFLNSGISGLIVKLLQSFGYFPRMAWWGVANDIIVSVTPIIAILNGGNMIMTSLSLFLTTSVLNIFLYVDQFSLLRKHGIIFSSPSIKLGIRNFYFSLLLSARNILENIRQQGIRIIISPLIGVNGLATFSTLRTGANVVLQGLGTITNPIMPELMYFLKQKNQEKVEACFGTIWIIVITLLAPAVVLLQVIIPPLYLLWTRGKIPFNPQLFLLLSVDVLVFAQAQPAIAIVVGNNLLKSQLFISFLTAIIVISGLYIIVPYMGINGIGIILILASLISTYSFKYVAKKWLIDKNLVWPRKSAIFANCAILIAVVAMETIVFFPKFKIIVLLVSLLSFIINLWFYWKSFPKIGKEKLYNITNKFFNVL